MKKARLIALVLAANISCALADGMQPETPLLLVDEKEGEASINVTNTDDKPALLYVKTEHIDEDKNNGIKLLPTQPVVRVEPGKVQKVRFILQTSKPLTHEHMMRAKFSGIPSTSPEDKKTGQVKVNIIFTQDIPVIISPKGQPENKEAWKLLTAKQQGTALQITNPSTYIVRLAPEITLGEGKKVVIQKTYILPGETLTASLDNASNVSQATIQPLSRYGYKVAPFVTTVMH